MTQEQLISRLVEKLPGLEKAAVPIKDYPTLRLKAPGDLLPAVRALKDDLGFNYLEIITTVDWLGPVNPNGYIRNSNPNVFLPEGATPQNFPTATPGVAYRAVFDMLWVLGNMTENSRIFLRLEVPRDHPVVPSLTGLFKAADWQERETYDLFGIVFEGHPNLIKILTPDFLKGHPLRKDYVHVKDRYDE